MPYESHKKWLITFTVILGTFIAALDSSIVNVAMPSMRGTLGASTSEITWVATAYMLANVVVMPSIAFLSSRFGRARYFFWSVVLFGIGSVMCGLARSLSFMIFSRVLQGIGGGALIPISQAIIRETFPPEEQGKAMGIFGMGVILGPAIGPTLGGWLTDTYSWPWIFYINVPAIIISLILIPAFIKDPPYLKRTRGYVDSLGLVSMAIGLSCLQIMLEKGQEHNWFQSSFIVKLALISFLALTFFVWWELKEKEPAVNLRVLKNVPLAAGTSISTFLGMGLFGSLFLLPLFVQEIRGYPVVDAGIAMLPRSLTMALTMPIAGRFYQKLGPRKMLLAGVGLCSISFFFLARLTTETSVKDLFIPQLIQGIGFGIIFVSLSTASLATVDEKDMNAATGLFNLVRTIFGSVGIALSATYLERATITARAVLAENLTITSEKTVIWIEKATSELIAQGIPSSTAHQKALALLDGLLTQQAAVIGYNHVFMFGVFLFAACIPLIFLFRSSKEGKEIRSLME